MKTSPLELEAPAPGRLGEFGIKLGKTLRHHARQGAITVRGAWWDVTRPRAERPVFVIGCSRSGTLMLYKTLQLAPELSALQRDLYAFWWKLHAPALKGWRGHEMNAKDASERDRDAIARHFYAHTGGLRPLGKNNPHGLCVPYLLAMFPDAHFIYIKRNAGDTLNSLMDGWAQPERFATWSGDLPARVAIDGGRITRWCFFIAEGWREYLNAPLEEVCAFQFHAIQRRLLDARRLVPAAQWSEVFYEDLIRDPLPGFRTLFDACGLNFTPALQQHAASALSRPFEPQSDIRAGKWRERGHAERIARVLPALRGVTLEMGYAA